MNKDELRKLAVNQANRVLELTDKPGAKIEQKNSATAWNEGLYKNVAEFNLRAWDCLSLINIELDANTGEVLSYENILEKADGN